MSQRKYQTSLTDFLRLSSFTKFQYIPYRLLNKLFYKQEKLFEIYIYIYSKLHINQLIKQLKQLQHSIITKTFTFNIQSPKPI